jgi:hypothetical protein
MFCWKTKNINTNKHMPKVSYMRPKCLLTAICEWQVKIKFQILKITGTPHYCQVWSAFSAMGPVTAPHHRLWTVQCTSHRSITRWAAFVLMCYSPQNMATISTKQSIIRSHVQTKPYHNQGHAANWWCYIILFPWHPNKQIRYAAYEPNPIVTAVTSM